MSSTDFSTEAKQLGRVAVLFGGLSAEREVSLDSGNAVLSALLENGVDAVGVDADKNLIDQIRSAEADRVFIALHGAAGEDGRVQALLELMGLPYTGSGVQASAIAMDKWRSKQVFSAAGIPTPEYRRLTAETDLQQVIAELGAELMVKPASEGSSIGMSRVHDQQGLASALKEALKYDSLVLAEKVIHGPEYTVAILDGEALPAIKLETDREFYDYEAKYLLDDTRYICPCGLPENKEKEMQQLARNCFEELDCKGWGRVDFMADAEGNFYVLEINTVPGMTSHSLVPMAATAGGYDFNQLVMKILQAS